MQAPAPFEFKGFKISPFIGSSKFNSVISAKVHTLDGTLLGSYKTIAAAKRSITNDLKSAENSNG